MRERGFIAGPDDQIDFYPASEPYQEWMVTEFADALPTHIRRELGVDAVPNRRIDTVVMGWRTYDPALRVAITSPYAHLRQIVVSRTPEAPDPGRGQCGANGLRTAVHPTRFELDDARTFPGGNVLLYYSRVP